MSRFSGAGSSLFSAVFTSTMAGGEEGAEAAHDPYFEPIVPLPELVRQIRFLPLDKSNLWPPGGGVYRYCRETKQ